VGGPPLPNTGPRSGGDLGLDFDIDPRGMPNTDFGMEITDHGRVVMKGPAGSSTLGLDYGVRIGSTEHGSLGQVLQQPAWERTTLFFFEGEGWQGGPWRMGVNEPQAVMALANVAFGTRGGSYIVEGAIPRHIFPQAADGGKVGLHITMFCGNDSANLVADYSGVPRPVPDFFPLTLKKAIANSHGPAQPVPTINPGDLVDYVITFASDRNTYPVTDVVLVDTLPREVTFVGPVETDVPGRYDPNAHTYTCTYPVLLPGASGVVRLQVQVRDDVTTDSMITNTVTIDSNETGPTVFTVGALVKPVVLEPLLISKTLRDGGEDVNDPNGRHVAAGETLTYAVCLSNPNDRAVTGVALLDTLPQELIFLHATGEADFGRYDPNAHTYTWSLPRLEAGESLCLELSGQVEPFTPAWVRVVNRLTADSDQTKASGAEVGVVVKPIVYRPLNVTKRVLAVNEEGVEATIPLVGPGDLLTYEVCFDNRSNDSLVQNVTVVDRLPAEVAFVNDDSMQTFGVYDPNAHSYTRHYASLMPGSSGCFRLTVQVRDDVPPAALLRNDVIIDSDETDPNKALALALTRPAAQPLALVKQIIGGGQTVPGEDLRHVLPGEEVTYALCVVNGNADRAVENVVLTDVLPLETVFVRATGEGEFGRYDPNGHVFVWTISSLLPSEELCLELTVQVLALTPAGTQIVNRASLEGDETESVEAEVGTIVQEPELGPLSLSKRIVTVDQQDVATTRPEVDPGNLLTYEIRFDNRANDAPIQTLRLVDVLPDSVEFVEDRTEETPGQYDPQSHTYTWNADSLAPGAEIVLRLAVSLREDVAPGTTVTNVAMLSGPDIVSEAAEAAAVVRMPVQGTVTFSPLILARQGVNRTQTLNVVLELPAGVLRTDIRSDRCLLDPSASPASSQEVFVEGGKTKIRASFPLTELFRAVPVNGLTRITVRGRLQSGRGFFAEGSVLLVQERPF
jgi:uncharacterized repeat protein (TIGR01451 family)